jgi:hypothetical protein
MKGFEQVTKAGRRWGMVVTAVLLAGLFGINVAQGQPSGLSLEIAIADAPEDFQFPLGTVIGLTMVLTNVTEWPMYTEKGFSQTDFHKSLILTDPNGERYTLIPETGWVDSMPPPFFFGDRAVLLAEALSPGAVKTVIIKDLSTLFPVMETMSGWYTLEAYQPFGRFGDIIDVAGFGVLGLADHPNNWHGTVDSNRIQFYLSPNIGAQVYGLVLDNTVDPAEPLFQAAVRVFKEDEIASDAGAEEIWTKVNPVLEGSTDNKGEVVWTSEAPCLLENNYTVFTKYADEFQQSAIAAGDSGWAAGCSGIFEIEFMFGQPPEERGDFAIFALNSVALRQRSVVLSGNIGAQDISEGPGPKSKVEVYIGYRVELAQGVQVYGDSVSIEKNATVFDVYYNKLKNRGKILGDKVTPLELPVWEAPPFLASAPGKKDIKVKAKKDKRGPKYKKSWKHTKGKKDSSVVELAAGAYDEVEIDHNGELHLLGGTYHFSSLKLDKDASLICLGPATILIAEGLEGHDEIYIGPAANSGISAADIVIYIGGIEEKKGKKKKPHPKVKKVVIGKKSKVMANIYAPNSTLEIGKECEVKGSFIAKDVIVGERVKVSLDSAF